MPEHLAFNHPDFIPRQYLPKKSSFFEIQIWHRNPIANTLYYKSIGNKTTKVKTHLIYTYIVSTLAIIAKFTAF
jgi:hypothetical protein